jgi:hypothetical protein
LTQEEGVEARREEIVHLTEGCRIAVGVAIHGCVETGSFMQANGHGYLEE